MDSDIGSIEKAYTTSDIASICDIETVTVRKYAKALESNGYQIVRDKNDRRMFFERDVTVFRMLQAMIKKSGMTVDNSAKAVTAKMNSQQYASVSVPDTPEKDGLKAAMLRHDEQYSDITRRLSSFQEENRELKEELQTIRKHMEQQEHFNMRLEQKFDQQEKERPRWWPFKKRN